MTSDSLKASASIITAFAAAPAQNGLFMIHQQYIYQNDLELSEELKSGKCFKKVRKCSHSLRMSLSTVLLPAPMPPPMRRRTGLLSLCATGAITSVHCESSVDAIPIAFISSTNVLKTLATFRFFVTLSNLCSLSQRKKMKFNLIFAL